MDFALTSIVLGESFGAKEKETATKNQNKTHKICHGILPYRLTGEPVICIQIYL